MTEMLYRVAISTFGSYPYSSCNETEIGIFAQRLGHGCVESRSFNLLTARPGARALSSIAVPMARSTSTCHASLLDLCNCARVVQRAEVAAAWGDTLSVSCATYIQSDSTVLSTLTDGRQNCRLW